MARRSDFTEAEWEAMQTGVTRVGLLVSGSDRGVLGAMKEARILAKHLGDARKKTSSQLVAELADMKGKGLMHAASADDFERETLESLRESVAVLEAKAPDEVEAYRVFVLEVAEAVAAAAKSPGHIERIALDLAGTPESAVGGEAGTLARIRFALGAPTTSV